jgi:hypothetical protein
LANWPEEAERGKALGIFPVRDRRDPVLDKKVCSSFLTRVAR